MRERRKEKSHQTQAKQQKKLRTSLTSSENHHHQRRAKNLGRGRTEREGGRTKTKLQDPEGIAEGVRSNERGYKICAPEERLTNLDFREGGKRRKENLKRSRRKS